MKPAQWEALGNRESPSWYLDPLVASQKRAVHLAPIQKALSSAPPRPRVLKTDLFEEAHGEDQILGEFPAPRARLFGCDMAVSTVRRAGSRYPHLAGNLAAADLRLLPFGDGSFDCIVSTSSLDHFQTCGEISAALGELARVLAPGGVLFVTLDNPWNPLYHALRWAGRLGLLPFLLGRTQSSRQLCRLLREHGLEIDSRHWLIHNPRGLSTLLFLTLRKVLGARASAPVALLLRLFALLGRLPTRPLTASFHGVIAHRVASRCR